MAQTTPESIVAPAGALRRGSGGAQRFDAPGEGAASAARDCSPASTDVASDVAGDDGRAARPQEDDG